MSTREILISCEHADHIIPSKYQSYFKDAENDLLSHKGYDMGSYEIAKYLARNLHAPIFIQKVSRLLIEMNRSLDATDLFSKYSIPMAEESRRELLEKYYYPYRNEVEYKVKQLLSNGKEVLHLSIHTFTPVLNGVERMVDVGILCDESDVDELSFSSDYKDRLSDMLPDKLVMINLPYNGADDGFTTYLRNKYQKGYLGIELEINQKFIEHEDLAQIKKALFEALM